MEGGWIGECEVPAGNEQLGTKFAKHVASIAIAPTSNHGNSDGNHLSKTNSRRSAQ